MGRRPGRDDTRMGVLERALLASAAGDQDAFADLYDALAPQVYGLVTSIVADPDRAAEVTAAAFVEVWRRAGEFDPSRSSARAWSVATAHLVAVRHRRGADASPQPRHRGVPEHDDDVLHLAYLGGCTEGEISTLMSTSPETTRRLITDSLVSYTRESR